jgi:hypothetical protein
MNSSLGGRRLAEVPDTAGSPLLYDSTSLVRNAADAYTSLPVPGRHYMRPARRVRLTRGNVVAYLSGTAAFIPDKRATR